MALSMACSAAKRPEAAEICDQAPICFRSEGMITPSGGSDAPGPYTLVADVVSDQAIAWVRVAFRRTRNGELQAQEERFLERTESGIYMGSLDGRTGDVLHYRLDTVMSGSEELIFWPGPSSDNMLTLRLLLPGQVWDAGAGSDAGGSGEAGPADGGFEAGVATDAGGPGPLVDAGPVDAG